MQLQLLQLPQDRSMQLFLIKEQQTLRKVVGLLVHMHLACLYGWILIVGKPFVAVAYLMVMEGGTSFVCIVVVAVVLHVHGRHSERLEYALSWY